MGLSRLAARHAVGGHSASDGSAQRSTIDEYLGSYQWEGKAGAFGYQDRLGWVHVLEGSESNVVGLPLEILAEMIEAARLPRVSDPGLNMEPAHYFSALASAGFSSGLSSGLASAFTGEHGLRRDLAAFQIGQHSAHLSAGTAYDSTRPARAMLMPDHFAVRSTSGPPQSAVAARYRAE